MLVMATKARMKDMYVFVRLNVSFPLSENVFEASPPPRIATSNRPCGTPASAPRISTYPYGKKLATHVRQYPREQDVRAHVRVVVLRELLLLSDAGAGSRLQERLAVLEVLERLLVDAVHVRRVCRYLEVDLRVAVLDDRAEIGVDFAVLLRAPRDL